MDIHPLLSKVYEYNTNNDGVSQSEAKVLMKMVQDTNAKITLETGLAHGTSAISMCYAANQRNIDNMHYAIDPNQFSDYDGAGISLIKNAGLEKNFKHLDGATHEVFPSLLNSDIQLDCAFVDGWHTFDYTLIDFFFIDKILRPGGLIAFHDMYGLAKQKVLRFILSHRDYEVAKEYMVIEKSRRKTFRFFLWRLARSPQLLFSWFHWVYQTKSPSGLIVLRKKSNFEPNFNFYKNF